MWEWLLPIAVVYALHRFHVIDLDYPLRQLFRFKRKGLAPPAEPKDGLFSPEAQAEAERLVADYGLDAWQGVSSRWAFAGSLFYLEMLERAFREGGVSLPPRAKVLDAGPSDWFYVRPLRELLCRFDTDVPREVHLDGVEVDAFQVYRDLHSRYDWAQIYLEGVPDTHYWPMDVRKYHESVDLALMLFPFLFSEDLLRWGLPRRYLKPAALLAHVWARVKPGGYLAIANQGAAEREEQHRLLAAAGMPIAWWARHDSDLYAYEPERYVTVVGPKAPASP